MRTHPIPTARHPRSVAAAAAGARAAAGRLARLVVAVSVCAAALAGCLRNPAADAAAAQALTEIADQLGALQQDNAALQSQVDSLRTVVARQDTVVRRLANMAGVPVP